MESIKFETKLLKIGDSIILLLPKEVSSKLPSRGQVMVEGTINNFPIKTPLEPDGRWSHWLRMDAKLLNGAHARDGDTVEVKIHPIKDWPEPEIPADINKGLATHADTKDLWEKITPMARWEWIRWIRATNRQETRDHRIEVARSKMKSGERRPCCWNRNMCTEPSISKSGVLLEPTHVR
ncbi:MAG TPA: YdeI/OmpD-associated family protein [Candidatus Saccharimonadales bacterium]|nr:YdeI/OmpD-associated family protein [Candidatus Saccharimonadales bacterium]